MSFPKSGQTNKWSTEVATNQSYENSAKYCLPKDFKYIVYFAIVTMTITGSAALYLGFNWKAPTGKDRWGRETGGTPGVKWYYVLVGVVLILLAVLTFTRYFIT